MKILHIAPTYYPAHRYGGPIKSVHELNAWLVKEGAEVTVYTTNLDGRNILDVPMGEPVDRDGVKVWYFPVTFRPWQYSRSLHKALAKTAGEYNLIHITSVFLAASTLGAWYAGKHNIPYIISPRGSLMKTPLTKRSAFKKKLYLALLEKKNLARAAAIHFTTSLEKKEYEEMKLPFKKAMIIPNGINREEFEKEIPEGIFRKKYIPNNKKEIVLFLGRISWKKGFDTLIPAFVGIVKGYQRHKDTVLVIAGGNDEGYQKEIEKFIVENKLQIGRDVIFTGPLQGEYKAAAFRESLVFTLPSYAENFGTAAVESMAYGTATSLTIEVGVVSYLKEHGENNVGSVVEKKVDQLTKSLLELLDNPERAREIGKQEKEAVLRTLLWDKIAREFIKEYNAIVKP